MANENTKQYAKKLLDRLIEIDHHTVEAYYDMGSIISSIQHGNLYDALGYTSMTNLIEEELTYTASTAFRYANMYRHFRRLHYLKPEALKLLKKFGLSHMCDVLPNMKDKIGPRAIAHRVDAIDQHQVNFTLTGEQLEKAHLALKLNGAILSDEGRWTNSSEAFMEMVSQNINRKPKLKAVG